MKRTACLALVVTLTLSLGVPAFAGKDDAAEPKAKSAVAAEIVKYVAWCADNGAKEEGLRAAAEAEALDAEAAGLADAKSKLEGIEAQAPAAATAAAKRRAASGPAIAKLYDKLASMDLGAAGDPRPADYLMKAVSWDPKPRAAAIKKKADDAADDNRPWDGARLMAKLRAADPEGTKAGKYDAADIDAGKSGKLLLGSASQALVAWVALPKDWKKGGKYPVLVGCEGAGCGYQGYFNAFVSARGSRSVIMVTPVSLSNTNALDAKKFPMYGKDVLDKFAAPGDGRMAFDYPGVEAILDDLEARFGAEEKVFQTGFSGGGQFTYWRLLQHPDKVRGIAPACGNFNPGFGNGAPAVTDGGPPIHVFTGEKDEHRDFTFGDKNQPGIEPQTNRAFEAFTKLGYKNTKRTMVPGAGHASLPAQVWEFVDEVIAGKFKPAQ
jgi:predicted esterase